MCLLKVQHCPKCFCNSLFHTSYRWGNWDTVNISNFPKFSQLVIGADIEPWQPDPIGCTELGLLSFVSEVLNWEDFLSFELPGQRETCPWLPLWPHHLLYTLCTPGSLIAGPCQVPWMHPWLILLCLRTRACFVSTLPVQLYGVPHIRGTVLGWMLCCSALKSLNNVIFESVFY